MQQIALPVAQPAPQGPLVAQPPPQGPLVVRRARRKIESEVLDSRAPFPDHSGVDTFKCMKKFVPHVFMSKGAAMRSSLPPSKHSVAVAMMDGGSLSSRTDPENGIEITVVSPLIERQQSLWHASVQDMGAIRTMLQAIDEDAEARQFTNFCTSVFVDGDIPRMSAKQKKNHGTPPMNLDPRFWEYVRLFEDYLAVRFSVGQFKDTLDRIVKAVSQAQGRIPILLGIIRLHDLDVDARFEDWDVRMRLSDTQFTREVNDALQTYDNGQMSSLQLNEFILRMMHKEIVLLLMKRGKKCELASRRIDEVEKIANHLGELTRSYVGQIRGNLLNLSRILSSVCEKDTYDYSEEDETYRVYPKRTLEVFTSMCESIKQEYERLRSLLIQHRREIKEHLRNVNHQVSLDIRAYHELHSHFAAKKVEYGNNVGASRLGCKFASICKHAHESGSKKHY